MTEIKRLTLGIFCAAVLLTAAASVEAKAVESAAPAGGGGKGESAKVQHPPIAVPTGYAAMNGGTTGGKGGPVVTVSTAAAFKAACESPNPMIIVVDGDLGEVGSVRCKSNKTIIGKDTKSGYHGNIVLANVENVIIQNLNITNRRGVGTGDGIETTGGTSRIFVTKCTFSDCKDGSFDIKRGSDFVTVSWCRFRYPTRNHHNFANLIGHADGNGEQDRGKLRVTMHHNWYDAGSQERMPRVRFGTVHVYNNFYGSSGNYCIGTGVESRIRVERCVFENAKKPWNDMGGMARGAQIGWNDLVFVNSPVPTYAPNKWPVFEPPYEFVMDDVKDVKSLVTDPVYGAGNALTRPSGS